MVQKKLPLINSAHGSDTRNIINRAIDLINAQGKSIQDLVAEGQLTPEQYAELLKSIHDTASKSEVRLNTSLQPINVSEMDTETKKLFTGGSVAVVGKDAVGNENIKDESVSADKLNFLNQGINQFNGDFKRVAVLTDSTLVDEPNSLTAIIPVIGGKTYYLQKDTGNRNRLAFHKSKPNLNNTPVTLDYYEGNIPRGLSNVKAPTDAKYLIYTVSYQESLTDVKLQITEDESYPFFIGYDFFEKSNIQGLENEFLSIRQEFKTVLLYTTGNNEFVADINFNQEVIKITEGTRAFWDNQKLDISNENQELNFYNSTDIQVAWIDLNTNEVKLNSFQTVPKYVPVLFIFNPVSQAISGINSDLVSVNGKSKDDKETIVESGKKYYFTDDLKGIYNKPDGIPNGAVGTNLDLVNSRHDIIYDIYDDLVSRFPERFSKTVYGKDASGLDINKYSYKAPRIGNDSNLKLNVPKIVMISAIHGYEQASAYIMATFFKDMMDNWQNKEQLDFLYWNVDFEIIPVVNPYGYNNNQRKNYNGIDLNRNFWEGTRTTGDPEDAYFGGFTGMSEPETNLVKKFLNENTDAEFYIDLHNIASGYPMSYSHNEIDRTITNNLYKTMSKKWAADYPQAPQDGTMMGYLRGSLNNNSTSYATQIGIQPILFETPWKIPFAVNKYDKVTLETGIEAFGNLLVTIFKGMK